MSTPDIPTGHARAATPEELTGRWRVGMSNPFSVYVQLGAEPSKDDPFVGSLVSPEAAAEAVRAVNAARPLLLAGPCRRHGDRDCPDVTCQEIAAAVAAERGRFVCMEPVATTLGLIPCARRLPHTGDCMVITPPSDWKHPDLAAADERARIAKGAQEMATTLARPGMGHGPAHGEQVRVVRLDELLDLINDGEGQT